MRLGVQIGCVNQAVRHKRKKSIIVSSDDWEKIKATRAMLILSHFAGLAVLVNLILAMLSILKAQKRVIAHSVTCIIQGQSNIGRGQSSVHISHVLLVRLKPPLIRTFQTKPTDASQISNYIHGVPRNIRLSQVTASLAKKLKFFRNN